MRVDTRFLKTAALFSKGDYQLEDGTYRPEFFEMVSDFEKRLNYAKQNTNLPDNPDMKKVEEFVMSVNRRAIDA